MIILQELPQFEANSTVVGVKRTAVSGLRLRPFSEILFESAHAAFRDC